MTTYSLSELQKELRLGASTLQQYLRIYRQLVPSVQPEFGERGTHRYSETVREHIRTAHALCMEHRGLSRTVALQQVLTGQTDPFASPEGTVLQAIMREVTQGREELRQLTAKLNEHRQDLQDLRAIVDQILQQVQDCPAQGTLRFS